jgi:GNAT superfamily N-acetyltransferase
LEVTILLEFLTIDHWDEQMWERAGHIYHEAFDRKGAKPDKVLRNMFNKGIGFLHLGLDHHNIVALAISGRIKGKSAVIIDYLAVHQDNRNKGIGGKLMNYIREWSNSEGAKSIIIEVEAERTSENLARINFWRKCGFTLTDYIHQYIWVPEPYQAMYLNLLPDAVELKNGESLFSYISQFHRQSFQMS